MDDQTKKYAHDDPETGIICGFDRPKSKPCDVCNRIMMERHEARDKTIKPVISRNYMPNFSGVAKRFVDENVDRFRYLHDIKKWYVWDENRWTAETGQVQEYTKGLVEQIYLDGILLKLYPKEGEEHFGGPLMTLSAQIPVRIDLPAKLASSDARLKCSSTDFDVDSHTLNTPSGAIDLNTGVVAPSKPDQMLSKITKTDPAPDWRGGYLEDFLNYVLPDQEQQKFMQRVAGYTAIGNVSERLVVFIRGKSGTGKSGIIEAIHEALGSYALSVIPEVFLEKESPQGRYSRGNFPGKRMIATSEFNEGQKVNRELLKTVTSHATTTSREIGKAEVAYTPQATLWISTNHDPWFGDDPASYARLTVIQMDEELSGWSRKQEPGRDYIYWLKTPEVQAQILAWILEGVREYLLAGLSEPESCRAAVLTLQDEQKSPVEKFVEECCIKGDDLAYRSVDLLMAFRAWAAENHPYARDWSVETIGKKLKQLGYPSVDQRFHKTVLKVRKGIAPKPSDDIQV